MFNLSHFSADFKFKQALTKYHQMITDMDVMESIHFFKDNIFTSHKCPDASHPALLINFDRIQLIHENMTKRWIDDEIMMKKMRKLERWKNDEEIKTLKISTCESRYCEGFGKVQQWQKDDKEDKRGLKDEKMMKTQKDEAHLDMDS